MIGNNTASAAEDFLIILSNLKGRAKTIGQTTFGSTGQPLMFQLPGGGTARICAKKDTYPDGKEFVGYGIQPDISVEENIQDIIAGKDRTLDVALKNLEKKLSECQRQKASAGIFKIIRCSSHKRLHHE